MITVTLIFDDSEGDDSHTPGALNFKVEEGATAREIACLIADGVEIFAEAMAGFAEHYADNPEVAMLVIERLAHEGRYTMEEVDRGQSFKPFFEE